jgi:hypothetical protein
MYSNKPCRVAAVQQVAGDAGEESAAVEIPADAPEERTADDELPGRSASANTPPPVNSPQVCILLYSIRQLFE